MPLSLVVLNVYVSALLLSNVSEQHNSVIFVLNAIYSVSIDSVDGKYPPRGRKLPYSMIFIPTANTLHHRVYLCRSSNVSHSL